MGIDFDTVDLRLAVTDDVPPNEQPVTTRCPRTSKHRHGDRTPSLRVYVDSIHCFGCGLHLSRYRIYSALALVLGMWDGEGSDEGYWQRGRDIIARYTSTAIDGYRQCAADKEPMDIQKAQAYQQLLWCDRANRLGYLREDRNLSDSQIKEAMLGHDGTRFTIPVFDRMGNLLTIRFRRDDKYATQDEYGVWDTPKYSGTAGRNGTFLYNLNHIPEGLTKICVVEGELDCLTMRQDGYVVTSPTNGAGQVRNVPKLLHQAGLTTYTHYVIITDMDEAGQDAAVALSMECERLGLTWERWMWDNEAKDITEYRRRGGDYGSIKYGEFWCNKAPKRTRRGATAVYRPDNLGRQGGCKGFGVCLDSSRGRQAGQRSIKVGRTRGVRFLC